jgi:hypothetical protein
VTISFQNLLQLNQQHMIIIQPIKLFLETSIVLHVQMKTTTNIGKLIWDKADKSKTFITKHV